MPPKQQKQMTLNMFLDVSTADSGTASPASPDAPDASEGSAPPARTVWAPKEVLEERKRKLLEEPKGPPPPPPPPPRQDPEATVAGMLGMLPRNTLDELLAGAVESGSLITEEKIKNFLRDLRGRYFGQLPDEILVLVFSYLPLRDRLLCVLSLCTRFRGLVSAGLFRSVSLLKHQVLLPNKAKWIDQHGTQKLLINVLPTNTLRSFATHSDLLSRTQLIACLEAHRESLQKLTLVGSNYAQRGRYRGFPVLSIDSLKIVTSMGESRYIVPDSLDGYLQKLSCLKDLLVDFAVFNNSGEPTVLTLGAPTCPLHRSLTSAHLGEVTVDGLFAIVQTCIGLKKLRIETLHAYGMSWSNEEAAGDLPACRTIQLGIWTRQNMLCKRGDPDQLAQLESLSIGPVEQGHVLPSNYLSPIAEFLGPKLKALTITGSGTNLALRGCFPSLMKLTIARRSQWLTPRLSPEEHARCNFAGFQPAYWTEVSRLLGGVEVERICRQAAKSLFQDLFLG
ncbi:hypothetical protein DFJ74DRAFT_763818 [Hyaloraphidium curvatum]|nr:hypothetical protein DFJ74DRAFT_763818 [Hyaloraphidium curvatum]